MLEPFAISSDSRLRRHRDLAARGRFMRIFMTNSERAIITCFHINILSSMHGFQDKKALLQAGYDVIIISAFGGALGDYS